jgi:predicted AAA+ superfamily ATPase
MNTKQLVENLILEWWQRPLPKIISREVNLQEYADLPINKIVSVIGFRRSGKTYALLDLAQKAGQKKCVYINFEDERLPRKTSTLTLITDVLSEISGQKPYYLLFDEIQNIPSWSLWARRINDVGHHKLFISGSSSKLSSAELPTELRGRSLSVHIYPLNFREFLRFKGASIENTPRAQLLHLNREYLEYGGFPEIALTEEGRRPLLLDEYYQTFVAKDIVERYKLRKSPALQLTISLLLNSPYITISKLAKSLKNLDTNISKTTVMRYLNFLEQSFFFKSLQLHTPSVRNRLKAERKPYFVDPYFISRYASDFSQNLGRRMENVVANQLAKSTENDPLLNVYYWKDYQHREIDFVLRRQEKVVQLVQVCFVSDGEVIPDREIKSLTRAANQLDCQNLLLLTWNKEANIKIAGLVIRCQPLFQWLLLYPK